MNGNKAKTDEDIVEEINKHDAGDLSTQAEATAEEKVTASKAVAASLSAQAGKEKVDEQVESHKTSDVSEQLESLIDRIIKLEARQRTNVYLERKSDIGKENDNVQTEEEKTAGKSKDKPKRKFKLWRTV